VGHTLGKLLLQKKAHGKNDGEELLIRTGLDHISFEAKVATAKRNKESTQARAARIVAAASEIVEATNQAVGLFY
jgi:hypothetical protein